MSCINKLEIKVGNLGKNISIDLNGKNLMVTGRNGSGKTSFLNEIEGVLKDKLIHKKNDSLEELESYLHLQEDRLSSFSIVDSMHSIVVKNISETKKDIEKLNRHNIEFFNFTQLFSDFTDGRAVFKFFEASRRVDINIPSGAPPLSKFKDLDDLSTSSYFEEYLVSYKTRQAYANQIGDKELSEIINSWFLKLENDLCELFEEKLSLEFNYDTMRFSLVNNSGRSFSFQELPSGYSAIMAIYSELITRVRFKEVPPDEIGGVVIIDEIDAHLHVSLQKKIFAFLDSSFPNVQFIVSTHSPFVLSSVSNSVIYDLSTEEVVDDLSLYSYDAILDGLFNVNVSSKILEEKTNNIINLMNNPTNTTELERCVRELIPLETQIDESSQVILGKAKLLLAKLKRGALDV
ncbi:AAA family ATPase [Pseudoalteromonas obscura]|uniref:AAA family ATPase n=1 Tax=Pseudoalteromonas obscura TaxID=3048491 RepID=A0ABT7EK34_9GAMM|nr:AAA family ATPase [Pseudoalteromonas sp. P94(2023)]MDK2595408.1 AAA family ATPase [Pseudoalteromonas sp. P94(2023)]